MRKVVAWWLCLLMAFAAGMPAQAEDIPTFSTLMEAGEYLRERTEQRDKEIWLYISSPAFEMLPENQKINDLLDTAMLMWTASYRLIPCGDGSVLISLEPEYRTGVRMVDAWRSGDTSTLSEDEASALRKADLVVKQLKAKFKSQLALEKGIFDYICQHVCYVEGEDNSFEAQTPQRTASYALLKGQANCEGYADMFYVLGSLAGF